MALQPQPQAFCSPRSSAQEPAGRGVAAEMEGKGGNKNVQYRGRSMKHVGLTKKWELVSGVNHQK